MAPSIQLLRSLRAIETVIQTSTLATTTARRFPPNLHLHPFCKPLTTPSHSLLSRSGRIPRRQPTTPHNQRTLHTTPTAHHPSAPPQSTDRGPTSAEPTQTDFGRMDVFSNTPAPTASIDACLSDGFHLDNGVKITGGSGLLLVSGEAFTWRPWDAAAAAAAPSGSTGGRLVNRKGQWDAGDGLRDGGPGAGGGAAWGLLELVWPKPGMCCFVTD